MAPRPPTPDEYFAELALYVIFETQEHFYATKGSDGVWFLQSEDKRPGRTYKVGGLGEVELVWESPDMLGRPRAFGMIEFVKVQDDAEWCDECHQTVVPGHSPFCEPDPLSVDEAYERLLTDKHT